jgi:arylsulfatase A-like enzyme
LLTGEYPLRADSWDPLFAHSGLIVDPAKITVADVLKRQDYATACIGKWHLGFGERNRAPDWNAELKPGPLELGFDYYFGLPTVSSHSPFVLVENHRVLGLDPSDPLIYGGKPPTQPYPEKFFNYETVSGGLKAHDLYRDDELGITFTQKAVSWIEENRDRPFFLYFAPPHIHHPFTPAPQFQGTSDCGRYGDFIHELDWMVGEVLATLDRLGLADDTLVIFTSDNGGMLNDGGREAWQAGHALNGELLGFKFGSWEGGHRVPFIVRWPGKVPAGTTSDLLVANVDILATVAAIVGEQLALGEGCDSLNQLPALTGTPVSPIRDQLVLAPRLPANLGLRSGKWIYIGAQGDGGFNDIRGGPASVALSGRQNSDVTAYGKIKPGAPPDQLYDLATDLSESRNVVREYPEIAARMREQLQDLVRESPKRADAMNGQELQTGVGDQR